MNVEGVDDALSSVMAELTAALGARACAVFGDVGDGCARVIHAHDPDRAFDWPLPAVMATGPTWTTGGDAAPDLLLAPVDGAQGERLMFASAFASLTPEERRAAEQAHGRAAGLAAPAVRLWLAARAGAVAVRSLQAALDWSGLGIVLVDAAGGIAFANQAARALLEAGDGLRRYRDRVVARELGDTVRLQLAIEQVIAAGKGGTAVAVDGRDAPLLAIGRAGAPALMLAVLPFVPADGQAGGGAILYVMDPARDMGGLLHPVCRAYRLSPAEALLARHLVAGETVAAAAARMGVKPMTARGYLKQIFFKTDTHRQPELVQLMLSSIIHTHPRATAAAAAAAAAG